MSTQQLGAGSVVRFGCTTRQLSAILQHGIPENEAGIPVGELMAYHAAAMAFYHDTLASHAAHEDLLKQFADFLQANPGKVPAMDLTPAAELASLPVVIDIRLEEACNVIADTHFVPDGSAEQSWKQWFSVRIQRGGGIPASWIQEIRFPRLIGFRELEQKRSSRAAEQTADAALMVGGLMQYWHKDAPMGLMKAFYQQHRRTGFSQSLPASADGLQKMLQLEAVRDPAALLLNQICLWQDLLAMCARQRISLS
jgi:hypothetical protein